MTTRGAGTNRAAMLRVSIPGNWRARSRADMLRWASIGALMAIWIGLVSWVLPVGASSGPTIPTEGSTAAMLRELGGLPIAPSHLSQAVLDEAWAKAERTRAEIDAARGLVRHEGGEEAYPYLIAGFSTRLRLGEDGRNHNIQVAARRLDGLVVPPGAVISFNEIVGIRTVDAGFAPALVLFEGQGVMGIGGGICQVSTTLFNTALLAGFPCTNGTSIVGRFHILNWVGMPRSPMRGLIWSCKTPVGKNCCCGPGPMIGVFRSPSTGSMLPRRNTRWKHGR